MKPYKRLLFIIAALAVLIILLTSLVGENRDLPAVSVLSEKAYANLIATRSETSPKELAGKLLFNGLAAPYADGKYFLTEATSFDSLLARLSWSEPGHEAYFMPDQALLDFAAARASGHEFHLIVTNGNTYFTERVVVTSLPVLDLTDDAMLRYKTGISDNAAMLRLFTPEGAATESISSYRLRGGSSRRHPKHSYRFSLYAGRHKKQALSLLGMRQSEDWILLPLYTDSSRMREKVALDLWNAVAETNPSHDVRGSSFEYVEVLRNGAYAGLYGLVTPLDALQCGVHGQSDTRLYKVIEYMWDYVREGYLLDRRALTEIIELKYPIKSTNTDAWEPMYRYVDAVLIDKNDAAATAALLDTENLIDHTLYLAVCSAVDNTFKNVYYLWRGDESGEYRFTKIPWDLNYTFGDTHESSSPLRTAFSNDMIYRNVQPIDLDILLGGADGPEIQSALSKRYGALRKTVFSDEALVSAFETQRQTLLDSGVFLREEALWPESNPSADLTEIRFFLSEHLTVLDQAYIPGVDGGQN